MIACLLLVLTVSHSYAQTQLGRIDSILLPVSGPHYQPEYTFDAPVSLNAWQSVKPGLHFALGS